MAERLVLEKKMKAPPLFLLASGYHEQKWSMSPKGSHSGMGMAFPSLHPPSVPVSSMQSIWREREARKRNRTPEIGSLEGNTRPLMPEAFNSLHNWNATEMLSDSRGPELVESVDLKLDVK